MYRISIIFFFLTWVNVCLGQINLSYAKKDSICQFGEKYDYPRRLEIDFLAVEVDDDYKIRELHRAIPKPPDDDDDDDDEGQYYFFFNGLTNYDPIQDSLTPNDDDFHFGYTLKDIYFFDINGDDKLDFIHYPRYYNVLWFDHHWYSIFIQIENGYKQLRFKGFIVDLNFNENKTLNELKTFQPPCCDSGFTTFYYYKFDTDKNELLLTKTEEIWTCQFKQK